jgi:hypothetical protein
VGQSEERVGDTAFDHDGVDWSTSYAQLLSRSAAHTQRSLQLYQQALDQVSRGRLPSSIFQDYYQVFAQKSGKEYAGKLTRLSAHFMSRMAQLNGRDAMRGNDEEDADAPPVFASSNPERWFEQYAEYAGQLNARALRAYRRQLEQVAAGDVTPQDVEQKAAAEAARQMPHYMEEAAKLYMGLLQELEGIRGSFQEDYLSGILALTEEPAKDAGGAVVLTAPLGGVAFASFTLTNTTNAMTPIRYIATEVRRIDGVGAAFAPKVSITPEILELGPGEEETITFSYQLDAERYDAEVPYLGFFYVTGNGDLRVELQLRIVATNNISDKK